MLQVSHSQQLEATEDLIRPPSPGFRLTLISRCFFGLLNSTYQYFDTLGLDLWLVRALAESGCIRLLLYPQQLEIFFRLAVPHFSTEVYTSALG